MFNLLNGIAAVAGSLYSRRPMHGLEDKNKRSLAQRIYRNLCWYGMQIQRRTNTVVRKTKKLMRPLTAFLASGFDAAVLNPARTTKRTFREIGEEFDQAAPDIAAAREKSVVTAGKVRVRTAARSAVKHREVLARALNTILPLICITALAVTVSTIARRNYALEVECGGDVVGYVANENDFNAAACKMTSMLLSSSEDIDNSLKPSYRLAVVPAAKVSTANELCDNILYNNENVEEAYGLYVDGRLIAAIRSEGDLSFILDNFRESFNNAENNKGSLSFVQSVTTKAGLYSVDDIVTSSELSAIIRGKMPKETTHTVKSTDTVEKILQKYNMTEERLNELNPSLVVNGLKKGSKLKVEKSSTVLDVKCVVVRSYTVSTPYKSTTVDDPKQYIGYKKLKTAGKKGTNKVTQEIVYVGGKEVSRKITDTTVLSDPVDEVYVLGTKKKPVSKPSSSKSGSSKKTSSSSGGGSRSSKGRFTWPLPGVHHVSSPFGKRWGKLHKGIDITTGGVYGRTVVAADSGKVTKAGWFSSYGNCVMIQHSGGYVTLYAHLSKVLVSNGSYVSKGQSIGKVGNSGHSTGPHLHFEIRHNGSYTNPLSYYN